jgi:aryl-alcohol dehydrogenase-like predicted oxidoreductase
MELGRTGLRVPRIGVGVMNWGDPKTFPKLNPARLAYGLAEGRDELQAAVDVSLQEGAGFFDTAAMYGNGESEKMLGTLIKGREALLASKFPISWFAKDEQVPPVLDGSLARLGVSTIDLYQVHFPYRGMHIDRLMEYLAKAHAEGKIRTIGVSNFSASQMREAHAALARHGIPLAANQVEYSLLCRTPETDGVAETCRELGITLIAYMPLASGALTGKYQGVRPTGLRRWMPYFGKQRAQQVARVVESLRSIGTRHDKSPGQVAIRWLVEQGTLPIPGAKNAMQAASNAAALHFELSADDVAELDQVSAPAAVAGHAR